LILNLCIFPDEPLGISLRKCILLGDLKSPKNCLQWIIRSSSLKDFLLFSTTPAHKLATKPKRPQ
jgi:hypothetical protein